MGEARSYPTGSLVNQGAEANQGESTSSDSRQTLASVSLFGSPTPTSSDSTNCENMAFRNTLDEASGR